MTQIGVCPQLPSHMCPLNPFTSVYAIQKCVAMCMDRYMDSFNLVSRVYAERLRKESSNM